MARISAENLDVKIRKAEGKVMRLGCSSILRVILEAGTPIIPASAGSC